MTDQTSETTPDGLDVAAVRERVEAAVRSVPARVDIDREGTCDGCAETKRLVASYPEPGTEPWLCAECAAEVDLIGTDIPLLLAALDEARREAADTMGGQRVARLHESYGAQIREAFEAEAAAEARATAAESARGAAEGALRDVRARMEEIAVMWECEPHVERLDVHRQLCPGCHRADVIRAALAPVTTDETEGGA